MAFMPQTKKLIKILGYKTHLKERNLVQLIASYVVPTEDCSVSQEQWQKEIQPEFREKELLVLLLLVLSCGCFCCTTLRIKGYHHEHWCEATIWNRSKRKTGTSLMYKMVAKD